MKHLCYDLEKYYSSEDRILQSYRGIIFKKNILNDVYLTRTMPRGSESYDQAFERQIREWRQRVETSSRFKECPTQQGIVKESKRIAARLDLLLEQGEDYYAKNVWV